MRERRSLPSRRRDLRRWKLSVALAVLAGCGGPPAERGAPQPLRVEYAGCAGVTSPGPVCALSPRERRLTIWVALPARSGVRIEAGGAVWRRAAPASPGGYRYAFDVPAGAASLLVRTSAEGGEAFWRLRLSEVRWPPLLVEANRLQGGGDEPSALRARELVERGLSRLPAADRALARSVLARLHLGLGDRAAARRLLTLALPEHAAAGRILAAADDSRVLAWLLIQERDFAAARRVLADLELPAGSPAEALTYLHYSRGLLAEQVGDARTALAELGAAAGQAARVGLRRQEFAAGQVAGRQLQALGRSREAAARFANLSRASGGVGPCARAEMLVNQAWSLLLAGEAGDRRADPLPLLVAAEEIARRESCPDPEESRLNSLLNRTLAHLQAGQPALARIRLEEARPLFAAAPPLDRLWAVELEARLDAADGDPEGALRGYARLDRLSAEASSPEGRWRAAFGTARSAAALGRRGEALAACRRAERLLDLQSAQVPIHEGRSTFAAQRARATELHLRLLLEAERNEEALEVARRARSRAVRDLALGDRLARLGPVEQAAWDAALGDYWRRRAEIDAGAEADRLLPADELLAKEAERSKAQAEARRALDRAFAVLGRAEPGAGLAPLRPGEVLLAFHPLARGWAGFAFDGRQVAVSRFPLEPELLEKPEALSARLLGPFREILERHSTKRLRVLPFGPLRAVDFHALPFGGEGHVLLERFPLVYGLDTPVLADRRKGEGGRSALLVSNPNRATRDLPAAEEEARRVAEALRSLRPAWTVESLASGEATAGAVRRALPRAAVLHYAGHGSFAGFEGWESELPLAAGSRLALGDLLALGRVPPWVILSGCDAGRPGDDAPGEGLNLAHAFLLAGSRTVVAATRPVEDRTLPLLFSDLYRGWSESPDLAALLRAAQLAARRRGDAADWAAFRAFEP